MVVKTVNRTFRYCPANITLDIDELDNARFLSRYTSFMDIKKYRAVTVENKRIVIYAKSLQNAKDKIGVPVKSIYRI